MRVLLKCKGVSQKSFSNTIQDKFILRFTRKIVEKKQYINKQFLLIFFIFIYNLNENYFRKQIKRKSHKAVLNQVHYKKTANIVGIFATSRLVTFFCLITYFCCRHNVRIFVRSDLFIVFFSQFIQFFFKQTYKTTSFLHFWTKILLHEGTFLHRSLRKNT